jgi:hypothetical protein
MPKKTIKIKINYDFITIGIIEKIADYKMAWLLNNILACNFKRIDVAEINIYECIINDEKIKLISNYSATKTLFKEIKEINFLIKVNTQELAEFLLEKIKSSQKINFAMILDKKQFYKKNLDFLASL